MAEWKKVIVSGSNAELNQVSASGGFSGDGSGLTGISADSLANNLTVDDSTVALDSGTTFNGSAAKTISVKDAGITLAKQANLAADKIIGRASGGGAGVPQALTATQVRTIINVESGADVTDATNVAANLPSGTISSSAQVNHDSTTNFASNEHFTQANITTVGTVTAGSVTAILPSGTISSSAQVNHDQTTNFASNEHFTQANITTVGTVTTGDVSAILPSGTVSGSAQVLPSGTVSGSAQVAMGGDISGNANNATVAKVQGVSLTSNEASQLANINSVTITNTQWGYVGALDQSLTTTSDVNFNDLTLAGDLVVSGDTVTLNTANLNIEDQFILLHSGSSTNTSDSGIIFGGSGGTAQQGKALIWDSNYAASGEGRLAVRTTDLAANSTSDFAAGTTGYYVAGVFEGTATNAATAKADHNGNIRIESNEIYIYA